MSENIEMTNENVVDEQPALVESVDLKEARKQQWRTAIEAELQSLIKNAAQIRTKITTAKTKYKKEFYTKKFDKINAQVRQYLGALQRLGPISIPESEGSEHGDINTTS